LFFDYNQPIIKHLPLILGFSGLFIFTIMVLSFRELFAKTERVVQNKLVGVIPVLVSLLLVYAFLQSALLDYFQPFSLYDDVIYLVLVAFLLLVLRFVIQSVMIFLGKDVGWVALILSASSFLLVVTFWGWNLIQRDFDYQNIVGEPFHIFQGGQDGYDIYRIPSLIAIPQGSTLADGTTLTSDTVIALAEGRRSGSLDDGDIDLVMKHSPDGGTTWSDLKMVRRWEDGIGKIGNPTPVFDADTGILYLFHIAGSARPYTTWVMQSLDGGRTFSEPHEFGAGIVGPGHGIQISTGDFEGRLLIPAHFEGSSAAWFSDDHGETWQKSQLVGVGNESEIAEAGNGELIMAVRTNHPVSKPHDNLYQLFSTSKDGGKTWSPATSNSSVRTPICMVSIVQGNDSLYFSYPDDFHSRAKMTIAKAVDSGADFTQKYLIYPGPAGYSDMGVLSNGDILLLFENGAVEYDERITLVRFIENE